MKSQSKPAGKVFLYLLVFWTSFASPAQQDRHVGQRRAVVLEKLVPEPVLPPLVMDQIPAGENHKPE